jgi:hypothetical protein
MRNGILVWLAFFGLFRSSSVAETTIEINFLDQSTGEKIASRLEFTKPLSKAPRPRNALVAGRQLLVEGTARFLPAPGAYEFMVRRGPEFSEVRSGFELERNAQDAFDVFVPHTVPMRSWGWHSGDLHGRMAPELLSRWMRADDLDVVATSIQVPQTSPDGSKRSTAKISGEASCNSDGTVPRTLPGVQTQSLFFDQPGQAGVLIHRFDKPSNDSKASTSFEYLSQFGLQDACFSELTRPWERDVPLLLATGKIDSIQVLSSHLQPDLATPLTPDIRNPDGLRFKGRKGLGRLVEHIYWQALEAGFRMPPTAGSGFDGKIPTHLGYNRIYVWLSPELPRDVGTWWSQLRSGHAMVTNGPLLRATINGQPPGSVHPSYRQQPIGLDIELELTVRDPVEYLDVIFNGKAIYQARLEEHAKRGQFPPLLIKESGWLVLRVVTEHEASYRMATTAPFYFEFDSQPRISRSAVKFFRDWLDDSRSLIEREGDLQANYREPLSNAIDFWNARAGQANAE